MEIERSKFEELVASALDDLPEEFKRALENIEVVVEDEPSSDVLMERKIKPPDTLLGLYHGVPLSKRGQGYVNPLYAGVLPDKVSIYQKPIQSVCRTRAELKRRVQEVVMHEIGHYFGMSEEQLEEI